MSTHAEITLRHCGQNCERCCNPTLKSSLVWPPKTLHVTSRPRSNAFARVNPRRTTSHHQSSRRRRTAVRPVAGDRWRGDANIGKATSQAMRARPAANLARLACRRRPSTGHCRQLQPVVQASDVAAQLQESGRPPSPRQWRSNGGTEDGKHGRLRIRPLRQKKNIRIWHWGKGHVKWDGARCIC